MKGFEIEKLPLKPIFIVLILLQIGLIASKFSVSFSDYVTWIILFLSIPLCFFLVHYLKALFEKANAQFKYSKEVYKQVDGSDQTNQEVRRLMESSQFKEYQEKKIRRVKEGRKSSFKSNFKQIEELQEFAEKQIEIFA